MCMSVMVQEENREIHPSFVFQSNMGEGNGTYSSVTSTIDEIFAPSDGSGYVDSIKVQMKDNTHNIWFDLPDIPTLTLAGKPLATIPTKDILNSVRLMNQLIPNCGTGEIRIQFTVVDDKSKDTFVFVKYGKQA